MKLTKKNLNIAINKLGTSKIEQQSDIWKRAIKINFQNKKIELNQIEKFKGLSEPPTKKNIEYYLSSNFPYFHLRNIIKDFVKLNSIKRKLILLIQYKLFRKLNIKFPKFNKKFKNFYYNFEGKSFNSNLVKYAAFLINQKRFINEKNINTLEIGAGYGGLCEVSIINKIASKYIIIDLNETLSISMNYLCNSNELIKIPKIYFEKENIKNEIKGLDNYIVFISVNDYLKNKDYIVKIFSKEIKMIFNSSSFSEMSPNVFDDYVNFIEKFNDIYLYSSNSRTRYDYGGCKAKDGSNKIFEGKDLRLNKKWEKIFSYIEYDINEHTFIGYLE